MQTLFVGLALLVAGVAGTPAAQVAQKPAGLTLAKQEAKKPAPADPVSEVRERVGQETLERLLRTRDGRLIGVVAEGMALPPAEVAGPVLMLPANAAAAINLFGEASPLAGSEVLFERQVPAPDPEATRRRMQLAAAERKLTGARALGASGRGYCRTQAIIDQRGAVHHGGQAHRSGRHPTHPDL